jgi:hypothetical protein
MHSLRSSRSPCHFFRICLNNSIEASISPAAQRIPACGIIEIDKIYQVVSLLQVKSRNTKSGYIVAYDILRHRALMGRFLRSNAKFTTAPMYPAADQTGHFYTPTYAESLKMESAGKQNLVESRSIILAIGVGDSAADLGKFQISIFSFLTSPWTQQPTPRNSK